MVDEINPALTSPMLLPATNLGGRPVGHRDKIKKMMFDAREACIEANVNPFATIALFCGHADPMIALAAAKTLVPYLAPTYKAIEFGGIDPHALTVTLNLVPYGKADNADA